ncbi:OmpA family protein [Roseivirga echinicomitans]
MKQVLIVITLLISLSVSGQSFGEPSYIRSVYFGGGSSYVNSQQSKQLLAFLDSIPNVHNFLITVHSHTDNVGGSDYNEALSESRSQSVIRLLLENENIKKESIEIKDFGLFNPTYDNTTNYGRRMNRRVDVIFWLTI